MGFMKGSFGLETVESVSMEHFQIYRRKSKNVPYQIAFYRWSRVFKRMLNNRGECTSQFSNFCFSASEKRELAQKFSRDC